MQLSVNDTIGDQIRAEDGKDVGRIDDLLFDDVSSTVRYLVIDSGSWLSNRKLLLTPVVVGRMLPEGDELGTALTKQQVEDSPLIDTDKPVSRQQEESLHQHYGWTPYWAAPMAPGVAAPYWGAIPSVPKSESGSAVEKSEATAAVTNEDPHLRSSREVIGYYVGAIDGDIGHVEDLLIDEENWTVHYLVIDTRNWLPGKKVLVATDWLQSVDWHTRKIAVDLERERIKSSPEYDPSKLDRDYQERLYQHYGRDVWF